MEHTSFMVDFFSTKQQIYCVNVPRLDKLRAVLSYLSKWKAGISRNEEFLSFKLWSDLQAMVLDITSLVNIKLKRLPGTTMKPAVLNHDVVENHFCQLRSANGQNENPTYLLTQATQNAVTFGQRTINSKCNTDSTVGNTFTELPKQSLFSQKNIKNVVKHQRFVLHYYKS